MLRVPLRIWLVALLIELLAVALAAPAFVGSVRLVGRVFPGFLVYDSWRSDPSPAGLMRVAQVSLPDWSSAAVARIALKPLLAVDGRPVRSAAELAADVAARPAGTPVTYRMMWEDRERELVLTAQEFRWRDWCLVFGVFFLNAAAFLSLAVFAWALRPRDPLRCAFLASCACYAITLILFNRRLTFTPVSAFEDHLSFLAAPFLSATVLHAALLFPAPHRLLRLRLVGYLVSLVIFVLFETFGLLGSAAAFYYVLRASRFYETLVTVVLFALLIGASRNPATELWRQRVRLVTIGTLLGFGPLFVMFILSVLGSARMGFNLAYIASPLLPLCVAYAALKYDLLEIDALVRRGVFYVVLIVLVGAVYVAALLVFDLGLRTRFVPDSPLFPLALAVATLVVFNPMHARVRSFVDRVCFGARYDPTALLATASSKLACALTHQEIDRLVSDAVQTALPDGEPRLWESVPAALAPRLAQGRVTTTDDPAELYADRASYDAGQRALHEAGAEVAVPMERAGSLVGMLTVGGRHSGLFYTATDLQFLRALAQQGVIALQNAASYEAVLTVNAELEQRVRERTMRLVQAEKMASLGQLVAGVAHELNNPASFVHGSLENLTKYFDALIALIRAYERVPIDDPAKALAIEDLRNRTGFAYLERATPDLLRICIEGSERIRAIVDALHTFARADQGNAVRGDVTEGVDGTVRLLADRIARLGISVHRDYQAAPPVEGQHTLLNQVWMSLLGNAVDAVEGRPQPAIWVGVRKAPVAARAADRPGRDRSSADGAPFVEVEIKDNGIGITPQDQQRVFDPFFTTKAIGQGVGLGLSVAYQVIKSHQGTIEISSEPGVGTVVAVRLPAARDLRRVDAA